MTEAIVLGALIVLFAVVLVYFGHELERRIGTIMDLEGRMQKLEGHAKAERESADYWAAEIEAKHVQEDANREAAKGGGARIHDIEDCHGDGGDDGESN